MEAVTVDKLDPQLVANGLAEAQKRQATTDEEKAEVAIHLQVYQAMNNAISKK